MKQIRMKTLMAGPTCTRHPGEVCMVSPEEAAVLVDGGYAEAVVGPEETAAKAAPEITEAADENTKKARKK